MKPTIGWYCVILDGKEVAIFGSGLQEMAEKHLAKLQALCIGTQSRAVLVFREHR